MKSTAIASLAAAASLGFASLAQAQDWRPPRTAVQQHQQHFDHRANGHGHGRPGVVRHDPRYVNNGPAHGGHVQRGYVQRGYVHGGYAQGGHVQAHAPRWQRGGYVPHEYRGRGYVVDDWRARHLQQPPSGYQWVRSGDNTNYALIAIATGLIASIVLSQ